MLHSGFPGERTVFDMADRIVPKIPPAVPAAGTVSVESAASSLTELSSPLPPAPAMIDARFVPSASSASVWVNIHDLMTSRRSRSCSSEDGAAADSAPVSCCCCRRRCLKSFNSGEGLARPFRVRRSARSLAEILPPTIIITTAITTAAMAPDCGSDPPKPPLPPSSLSLKNDGVPSPPPVPNRAGSPQICTSKPPANSHVHPLLCCK
mmetsp:Transcript_29750/g.65493  ORF Transcript_29750/g.65493 Transcript_29750/m.65493 type:complete len:208 (+) Transcript_29750:286-909(+)